MLLLTISTVANHTHLAEAGHCCPSVLLGEGIRASDRYCLALIHHRFDRLVTGTAKAPALKKPCSSQLLLRRSTSVATLKATRQTKGCCDLSKDACGECGLSCFAARHLCDGRNFSAYTRYAAAAVPRQQGGCQPHDAQQRPLTADRRLRRGSKALINGANCAF